MKCIKSYIFAIGDSPSHIFLKRTEEKSINCWLVHSLDLIRMWLCGFETWREQARLLLDWLGLQGDGAAEAGRRRGREKMLEGNGAQFREGALYSMKNNEN